MILHGTYFSRKVTLIVIFHKSGFIHLLKHGFPGIEREILRVKEKI